MSNIITLPVGTERQWRTEVEPKLRAEFVTQGMPSAMVEWIFEDFRPRFATVFQDSGFEHSVPAACAPVVQEIVDRISENNSRHMFRVVQEMLKLEAELYKAKFEGGPPLGAA